MRSLGSYVTPWPARVGKALHPAFIDNKEFERPIVRVVVRLWPQSSRRRCVSALMPGSTSVRSGIHRLCTRGRYRRGDVHIEDHRIE